VYLQTHARRCYGVAQSGEVDTARRIPERVRKGDLLREGFGSRDVWRRGGPAWPIRSVWRKGLGCWWSWDTWRSGRSRPGGGSKRCTWSIRSLCRYGT